VVILGGGMAGLAAAWHLTEPAGPGAQVTVYQRGGRLGGKAASSRGRFGRIEEHGLHVWLGHYENAFRLIRACYDELDRAHTDPACPIATWRDAFAPASSVGVAEGDGEEWREWLALFPEDSRAPGDPDDGALTVAEFVRRAVALLARFGASLADPPAGPRAVLSTRPEPPRRSATAAVGRMARGLASIASGGAGASRAGPFVDLVLAMLRGVVNDRLMTRGYTAIDDQDFRAWLARHGASPATLESPLVGAMYDLVFGYVDGDRARPQFSAGLGLHLAGRLFFSYRGAIFWKMRAGMGDVVIAPLYQALRARGVRFEFFHRLDELQIAPDGHSIGAVRLGRQVALRDGLDRYEPLVRVRDLPGFASQPDLDQLDAGPEIRAHDLESHWCEWPDGERVDLRAGRDYDAVVLAVSIGMIPHVCGELLAADARWRAMTEHVGTVATQAFQVWLAPDEHALGRRHAAVTITGYGEPFDTYSSMSHLLPFEAWPDNARPQAAAAFCAVLPTPDPAPGRTSPPRRARAAVRRRAVKFLDERGAAIWPAAADGFQWAWLCGDGARTGPARFGSQYWRANVDPSDRYVQALPGTDRFRLRADASGYDNLFLAGDWIDCGINAGCIEAAVVAGRQAANAVMGRPIAEGVTAFRPHADAP
jgi:uncharacterized protein with NAD-binding domain and iron-sulfur cluster